LRSGDRYSTGIGVVYGREDIMAETPPWQGGGNMIADVTPAAVVVTGMEEEVGGECGVPCPVVTA
jgi:selenocysteine lyase/cysteine desulfurase